MIANPTDKELDALLAAGSPVILEFYSEMCAPCRMMLPIFARAAETAAGRAEFVTVDVDKCPGLIRRYRVMRVPTVIGIAGGEVRETSVGIKNEPALIALVDKLWE